MRKIALGLKIILSLFLALGLIRLTVNRVDADCVHRECQAGACVSVSGCTANQCSSDRDCRGSGGDGKEYHYECVVEWKSGGYIGWYHCVRKEGGGTSECGSASDCCEAGKPPNGKTPTPAISQTPTPPPGTCDCWLLISDHPDLANVKRGETLTFSAEAYVSKSQPTYVKDMTYVLDKDGSIVAESLKKPAVYVRDEVFGGEEVKIYQTNWSYTVPDTDEVKGLYHLSLSIYCAGEEAVKIRSFFVQAQRPTSSSRAEPNPFHTLLKRIFGTVVQFITPQAPTLKLGTFEPRPTLSPSGCTDLYFRVVD